MFYSSTVYYSLHPILLVVYSILTCPKLWFSLKSQYATFPTYHILYSKSRYLFLLLLCELKLNRLFWNLYLFTWKQCINRFFLKKLIFLNNNSKENEKSVSLVYGKYTNDTLIKGKWKLRYKILEIQKRQGKEPTLNCAHRMKN